MQGLEVLFTSGFPKQFPESSPAEIPHNQKDSSLEQTLLGEIAHFGFCPPKIGFFGGPGGVPEILFSLES